MYSSNCRSAINVQSKKFQLKNVSNNISNKSCFNNRNRRKKMFRTFFSKKDVNSPELWLNVHSTDSTKDLHIFDGVETSLLLAEWFLSMVRLFIIP